MRSFLWGAAIGGSLMAVKPEWEVAHEFMSGTLGLVEARRKSDPTQDR